MSLKYFGTDGIRGSYGKDPISELFAEKVALGLSQYLLDRHGKSPLVAIGRDTRESGVSLKDAFAKTFSRCGIQVLDLGVVPTPVVSFAVTAHQATLGVAITASHNPACDNGFKLFNASGTKFTPEDEAEFELLIDQSPSIPDSSSKIAEDNGKTGDLYLKHLKANFSDLNLNGLKIAVDTANGATTGWTPRLLKSLGADVIQIGDQPDGQNINDGVGSECPDILSRVTVENACDLGIAHDGDGDRAVWVDESGHLLTGENFMAIIAKYGPSNKVSADQPLITTVQSNLALDYAISDLGAKLHRTSVGDRNLIHAMKETGGKFGAENSGHYIFTDVLPTGDGLIATLKLLQVLQIQNSRLSAFARELKLYPSRLLSLKVAEKKPIEQLSNLRQAEEDLVKKVDGKGRVMIRYSGTENKIRILLECESELLLEKGSERLRKAAGKDLEILV